MLQRKFIKNYITVSNRYTKKSIKDSKDPNIIENVKYNIYDENEINLLNCFIFGTEDYINQKGESSELTGTIKIEKIWFWVNAIYYNAIKNWKEKDM